MTDWPQTPIEVGVVDAPNGLKGVLMQLPDGYAVMSPDSAKKVGLLLIEISEKAQDD